MRRSLVITLSALALAACQAGQPEQDQNLSERGSSPEVLVNEGGGNIASGTMGATEQAEMGDTMPDEPAGPRGDRASGTGGDSVPTQ